MPWFPCIIPRTCAIMPPVNWADTGLDTGSIKLTSAADKSAREVIRLRKNSSSLNVEPPLRDTIPAAGKMYAGRDFIQR